MKIYNKLVRDKIPAIIENSGKNCVTHIASQEEYQELLEKKLLEEVKEYQQDKNIEEIADIMEVVVSLADAIRCGEKELFKKRMQKKEERGGFSKGIVLETVDD